MEGYDESCPGIYYDRDVQAGPESSRLALLLDCLGGYDYYSGGVSIKAGGAELWFLRSLKYHYGESKEYLAVGGQGPCEPLRFPSAAVTKGRRQFGSWGEDDVLQFDSGTSIPGGKWGICVDDSLSFFCRAYERHDPARMAVDPAYIYLYSTDDPNIPLYATRLARLPDMMLKIGSDLYIVAKDNEHPSGLHMEICAVENGKPAYRREVKIACPRLLFAERLEFGDFDPFQGRLLVSVHKSWPYKSEAFLYNIEHATLTKLRTRKDGYPLGFLNPAVLENAVRCIHVKDR